MITTQIAVRDMCIVSLCSLRTCRVFAEALRPKVRAAAVLSSGSAQRVCEWAGRAGWKPKHQPHPDELHHLPAVTARYGRPLHTLYTLQHQ